MSNENKTAFQISADTKEMRKQANEIARQEGLTNPNDVDAFRHAYVSAKTQEYLRSKVSHELVPTTLSNSVATAGAYAAGSGIEWGREAKERYQSSGMKGNPKDEWAQDMDNNAYGREIEETLQEFDMPPEEKEKSLRKSISKAVKEGTIQTNPSDTNQRYYSDQKQKDVENGPQSSILDGIGDAAGTVGDTALAVGHVAFDTAKGVVKDTLVHVATQAALADGADGKAALGEAAKVVMSQTLSRMHGLVMHEYQKATRYDWRDGGFAGPIPEPDAETQSDIEQTVNDPANAGIFVRMGEEVGRILRETPNIDPASVLVGQVMDVLRGGDLKVQPHILVPDIPSKEDETRAPKGDERALEVAGVTLPIRLPQIELPQGPGTDGRTPDFNLNAQREERPLRGSDGVVRVAGYSRGGSTVRAHTRSAPDGDVTNNFSFKISR